MAKKRGNNEGTIYQRANGTWRAQIRLEGHRLSFTAPTRRECLAWLKNTIRQIDDGMRFACATTTLGDFMSNWLINIKPARRPSTWMHYEQLTHKYILPQLGSIKLNDLSSDQIQHFYNHLTSENVGVYTIVKIHAVLHAALEQAIKEGLLNRNATNVAIPPTAPAREMTILDENQASQLLVAAHGSRLEALLQLALATGMRQMELLGLKWSDLDWSRKTIKVERQLARLDGVQFYQLKTKYSRRTVLLGDRTIEVLRCHYKRQGEEREKAGEHWNEYGLIFTSQKGTPYYFRNVLRGFKHLLKEAGLPNIRFDDLRHTSASLMLNYGIPVVVVSRRLGHARPSITLDICGHLVPGMQAEAARKIDDLTTPVKY